MQKENEHSPKNNEFARHNSYYSVKNAHINATAVVTIYIISCMLAHVQVFGDLHVLYVSFLLVCVYMPYKAKCVT